VPTSTAAPVPASSPASVARDVDETLSALANLCMCPDKTKCGPSCCGGKATASVGDGYDVAAAESSTVDCSKQHNYFGIVARKYQKLIRLPAGLKAPMEQGSALRIVLCSTPAPYACCGAWNDTSRRRATRAN
jgi:hypothetical protein